MSNQVATIQDLNKGLASQSTQIQSMLPEGMDVKRFMRTTSNAIATHPQQAKILAADRQSLFNSCQKAASDGLMLDGKEATLVSFYDKNVKCDVVQYMPMTQGLVKLARNSGEIGNIHYGVVYKNDEFVYETNMDGILFRHKAANEWEVDDRGEPVAAYCMITLSKSNEKIIKVLPKSRILQIASGGKNGYQYDPQKGSHFEEWWGKTAIKSALKYAPKSTFLDGALSNDNEGYDFDAGNEEAPAAPVTGTSDAVNNLLEEENDPVI